jgi:hypothetical protein
MRCRARLGTAGRDADAAVLRGKYLRITPPWRGFTANGNRFIIPTLNWVSAIQIFADVLFFLDGRLDLHDTRLFLPAASPRCLIVINSCRPDRQNRENSTQRRQKKGCSHRDCIPSHALQIEIVLMLVGLVRRTILLCFQAEPEEAEGDEDGETRDDQCGVSLNGPVHENISSFLRVRSSRVTVGRLQPCRMSR